MGKKIEEFINAFPKWKAFWTHSCTNIISEFNFESKSVIRQSGSTSKISLLSSITHMVLFKKKSNCCLLYCYFDTRVGTLLSLMGSKCYISVLHTLPVQVQTHLFICWVLIFMWDEYTHIFEAHLL